jgi:hypothetical protein
MLVGQGVYATRVGKRRDDSDVLPQTNIPRQNMTAIINDGIPRVDLPIVKNLAMAGYWVIKGVEVP